MTTTSNNSDKNNMILIIAGIAITIASTIAIGISVWGFDTFMRIMG